MKALSTQLGRVVVFTGFDPPLAGRCAVPVRLLPGWPQEKSRELIQPAATWSLGWRQRAPHVDSGGWRPRCPRGRARSVIQGGLEFLEFLGPHRFLDLGGQLLQLVDIACSFHREVEPETPQAQGGGQPGGDGVGL